MRMSRAVHAVGMKLYLVLLFCCSTVHGGPMREYTCPRVCDVSLCALDPRVCYYGRVKDACGCCSVCAAGEGENCGAGTLCGDGLRCHFRPDSGSNCVCASTGPVCASDGRTYPSICRLRAEMQRAEFGEGPALILIMTGPCYSGNSGRLRPGSMRYRFNFIADVVAKIVPAVVHLELFQRMPISGEDVSVSSGSGFVVSEDGWIVTNAHVLVNKHGIKAELNSGLQYDATIKDVDQKMDIALIKIEPEGPLPVLPLGQSSDLRPGEFVVAVGSPFSLQNTVTTGIISTAHRSSLELGLKDPDMDFIQTDAIINNGNSGGPLVNLDGDVIGINTLKVAAGISFAIPVDRIRQFLAESHNRQLNVQGSEARKKKFIGIRMLQLTPSLIRDLREREVNIPDVSYGVFVYEVIPGTAASSAGMMDRDVIVGINGQPIHTTQDVSNAVQSGAPLSVQVKRKDVDVMLTVIPTETE